MGGNFVQIEGEKGFIYVSGSNGLETIRVVTKNSDETFNEQPDPDRWSYEVRKITELVRKDDYDTIYSKLDVMLDVIETIENVRKDAGILFPGDGSIL